MSKYVGQDLRKLLLFYYEHNCNYTRITLHNIRTIIASIKIIEDYCYLGFLYLMILLRLRHVFIAAKQHSSFSTFCHLINSHNKIQHINCGRILLFFILYYKNG